MSTKNATYLIRPDMWDKESDTRYVYDDDDLAMRVILEKSYIDGNSPVWWRNVAAGTWQLKAESLTYYDSDNIYYYDALDGNENHGRELTLAPRKLFFGENDQINYVPIPQWLIDKMQYYAEEDARIENDLWEWANEHDGETFGSHDELISSAWGWFASHYLNGGQYSYGADLMIGYGIEYGYIEETADGYAINI